MRTPILTRHPCFSETAGKKFGRIHLPVAPTCNISCNYCNRRYDCANESRPGVTSEVLTTDAAMDRLRWAVKSMPYISTVGIAGPGDSLANPEKTFKTLEAARREFPDMHLCLSTNGLMLADYAKEIARLKVYLTVTVNSTDVDTAARIYRWVRFRGKNYYGKEGAALLLERQREGLSLVRDKAAFLKINALYIPGVNDAEMEKVADQASGFGAQIINVMPLIPAPGSRFEGMERPAEEDIKRVRESIGGDISVMNHCRQCRSDAVGMLGEVRSSECGVRSKSNESKFSCSC